MSFYDNQTPPTPVVPPVQKKGGGFWLFLLLLCLAGGGAWTYYKPMQMLEAYRQKRADQAGPKNEVVPVRSAQVEKGDMTITFTALGTVTSMAAVTVRTQINGQLMEVGFKEGQLVQKGDFLAQIDPRPYENTLAQAEGQLLKDKALLKDAELNAERYQKLFEQNSVSKQQRDTQESLVQQYKGSVQADEALLSAAKLNLTYCRITAPVSGRVGLKQVDPGNYVQASDTNGIVTLTQMDPISVLFSLPEDNLPLLMKRVNEGAVLEVTAMDRGQTTKLATGSLISVDNHIDTSTGTIKARAQFDNQASALFPNQFVNVLLLADTVKDVTLVPSAALLRGVQGSFVYLVKKDGTVTIRLVKTGQAEGDRAVVTEGLQPGDEVVIDGTDKLREGTKISLPEKEAAEKTSLSTDPALQKKG